jgi:tape measure domain-containing protein
VTDPKIRYDILANAEGEEDVKRLAAELEKLDDSIDPAAAQRAQALAKELRELATQRQALEAFQRSLVDASEAGRRLEASTLAVQKLRQQLEGVAEPTRKQRGELERLVDQETKAQAAYSRSTEALAASRAAVEKLGVSSTELAANNQRLEQSFERVRTEVAQLGQQGGTVQAFTALVQQTENARERFDQADRALERFRAELTGVAEPTLAQTRLLDRLAAEAHAAQRAFQSSSLAQAEAATKLRAAGVDTDRLVAAQQRLPPQLTATAAAARQAAQGYQEAGRAALAAAADQQRGAGQSETALQGLRNQLSGLQSLAAVAVGGTVFTGLVRDAAAAADAYNNLSARIRLVTGDGQAFEKAFEGVFDIARRTGTAVEETGQLFTRLAQTGLDAGQSVAQAAENALRLTETINQATQLSGGSAESARAAITQLIQGLQSGVLRGEEFNSVLEQTPRLARALAEGLGRTTGELRELAQAGQLTTETVVSALESQAATLQREFDQLPPTVGRAIQALSTEWLSYIGNADQATGASNTAARALQALADNLSTVATTVQVAGQAWLAYKALGLAATLGAEALALRNTAVAQGLETAARASSTAATAANTAALGVNTVAKRANAAAASGLAAAEAAAAAASAASNAGLAARVGQLGRLGGALGAAGAATLLFGDLIVQAGVALGEGAAKLAGYRDLTEELAQELAAEEEAQRRNSVARAEAAAKAREAQDAAQGLSKEARGLVEQFNASAKAGDSAAESVAKLSKQLDFSSPQGLQDGVAALRALEAQGQLTGEALQGVFSEALKGQDLALFTQRVQTLFGAIVDASGTAYETVQGNTDRLAVALQAALGEALRRTGVGFEELRGGVSVAARSAINDVDLLADNLDQLRQRGVDAGLALAASLDKALAASTTAAAVREVQARFTALGASGAISSAQLEAGLLKVRSALERLQDATPVIDSLGEAARKAGVPLEALTGGISAAGAQAISTVSALVEQIIQTGVAAERASPVLAEAFDKRVQAAITGAEVDRLREEIDRAASAGKLFGSDLERALETVKRKAQELSPAFQQAAADAKRLGVDLGDGVTRGAEAGIRAYERLKASGQANAQQIQQAFINLANEQIKANNNVIPEWVKVEAAIRGARFEADRLGAVVVVTGEQGAEAGRKAADGMRSVGQAATAAQPGVESLRQTFGRLESTAVSAAEAMRRSLQNTGGDSGFGLLNSNVLAQRNANIGSGRGSSGGSGGAGFLPVTREVGLGQAVNKPPGDWTYTLVGFSVPGVDANGRQLPGGWAPVRGPTGVTGAPFSDPSPAFGWQANPFGRAPTPPTAAAPPAPGPAAPAPQATPAPSPASGSSAAEVAQQAAAAQQLADTLDRVRQQQQAVSTGAVPVLGRFEIVLSGAQLATDARQLADAVLREIELSYRVQLGR